MKNKRITFDCPTPLAAWVKREAKAAGISVSDMIRGALRWLKSTKDS